MQTARARSLPESALQSRGCTYPYMLRGFERPDLAFPARLQFDFQEQTANGKRELFEQYEWNLSATLITVDFMLEHANTKAHEHWRAIAVRQLAYHWKYIQHFRREKPSLALREKRMKALFDEAIALGRDRFP